MTQRIKDANGIEIAQRGEDTPEAALAGYAAALTALGQPVPDGMTAETIVDNAVGPEAADGDLQAKLDAAEAQASKNLALADDINRQLSATLEEKKQLQAKLDAVTAKADADAKVLADNPELDPDQGKQLNAAGSAVVGFGLWLAHRASESHLSKRVPNSRVNAMQLAADFNKAVGNIHPPEESHESVLTYLKEKVAGLNWG